MEARQAVFQPAANRGAKAGRGNDGLCRALHAFDNPMGAALFSNPEAQTSRDCMRLEVDGPLVNAETGEPFRYAEVRG